MLDVKNMKLLERKNVFVYFIIFFNGVSGAKAFSQDII